MMRVFSFEGDEQVTRVSMNQGGKDIEHFRHDAHACVVNEDAAIGLLKIMGFSNIEFPFAFPFRFHPTREMAYRLYMYDGDLSRHAGELLETMLAAIVLDSPEVRVG